MNDQRCENCRFWFTGRKVCQKSPPQVVRIYGRPHEWFPRTKANDWCDEWQGKDAKQNGGEQPT